MRSRKDYGPCQGEGCTAKAKGKDGLCRRCRYGPCQGEGCTAKADGKDGLCPGCRYGPCQGEGCTAKANGKDRLCQRCRCGPCQGEGCTAKADRKDRLCGGCRSGRVTGGAPGEVYVWEFADGYKIGFSRNPKRREKNHRGSFGPFADLAASVPATLGAEQELHRRLSPVPGFSEHYPKNVATRLVVDFLAEPRESPITRDEVARRIPLLVDLAGILA